VHERTGSIGKRQEAELLKTPAVTSEAWLGAPPPGFGELPAPSCGIAIVSEEAVIGVCRK
jgi:hypothetical protein